MRKHRNKLWRLVRKDKPSLIRKTVGMKLYDAVCLICDEYGIDRPDRGGNPEHDAKRILGELMEKAQ